MKVGEKIRLRRQELKLTQREVAGERITRNLLSEIENGEAQPSLSTLLYLAERLDVSPGYLADDNRSLSEDAKQRLMPSLWQLYKEAKYTACIERAKNIPGDIDPDLAYLLACAHLCAAEECVDGGSVNSALSHLNLLDKYLPFCIYETEHLRARATLTYAMAKEPLTPRYALDKEAYLTEAGKSAHEDLYHYLLDESDYPYKNPFYQNHMDAKRLMKDHRYVDATAKLTEIIDNRLTGGLSVQLLYRVYSDLEICYRERGDYENAYKISSKKNALLTSFRN